MPIIGVKKGDFDSMKINTLTEDFEQLFDKAGLNEIEREFFADDIIIAIWEDFESAKDYYLDWNTQFCLVNHNFIGGKIWNAQNVVAKI